MAEKKGKSITLVAVDPGRMEEAHRLHCSIVAKGNLVVTTLAELGADLKRMRDDKLYIEMGYPSFEGYTGEMLGMKERQAYNYIRVYEQLPRDLLESGLGIKKLELLTGVPALDRAEFVKDHDLDGMSTRELRDLVKDLYGRNEQLAMDMEDAKRDAPGPCGPAEEDGDLRSELEAARTAQAEAEAARQQAEAALAQQQDEAAAPAVADEELAAGIRAEVQAELEKAHKKELAEAKRAAKKKAEEDAAQELAKAKAEAEKAGAEKAKKEMDAQLARIEAEKAAAAAQAEKLQKELQLASSADTSAFTLYFAQISQMFEDMMKRADAMAAAGNAEQAATLVGALRKALKALDGKAALKIKVLHPGAGKGA